MNNLEKLKKAIIKEIPEIVELKMGCRIKPKKNPDNVGRYIVKERREYINGITFIYYDIVSSLSKEIPSFIGCNDLEDDYEIIGRKITLADVLKVLSGSYYVRSDDGYFYEIVCDIDNGEAQKIEMTKYEWNLSKNDLNFQSKDLINFLVKIIVKEDE